MSDTPPPPPPSPPPPPPRPDDDSQHPVNWVPPRKRAWVWVVIAVLGLVAVTAILAAWRIWPFTGSGPRTDNAYVQGRTTEIAPQVTGTIAKLYVSDYAVVRKGQLLLEIDPATYAAQAGQSAAQVDVARANLANNRQQQASAAAQLAGQRAGLVKALADEAKARADYDRAKALVGDGSVSRADLDAMRAAWKSAVSALAQTRAQIRIASENLRTAQVDRRQLQAQLEAAQAARSGTDIQLGRTRIYAPENGQLGRVNVHVGQLVATGAQLFTLIPRGTWVIASYKESAIANVRLGQHASFTVDALGDARLHGTVTRIAPATAAQFSAADPSQASGNFVKIPQRIGVRIAVDPGQPLAARLRPGMSVEAQIDTIDPPRSAPPPPPRAPASPRTPAPRVLPPSASPTGAATPGAQP